MRPLLLCLALLPLLAATAHAQIAPRPGWTVIETQHGFAELVERLKDAVAAEKMGLVTQASASDGAAMQGITIPGNRVIGVYRNDFARRMLKASIAAGIEAPIRFYVTETAEGTATLSWKEPSRVFAPYMEEGGEDLAALAGELDLIFRTIGERAAAKE
jgi:uncharacterized protein (DUF302 family)